MSLTKRVGFIVILTLLAALFTAAFDFPLYDSCDTPHYSIESTTESNTCHHGSFISALTMGLTGTSAMTYMDDQPNPVYTPNDIINLIDTFDGHTLNALKSVINADKVVPDLVDNLGEWVHYNGIMSQYKDFSSMCDSINQDDAFYLADTRFSHDQHAPQAVVLITSCDYTYGSNTYELTIHHPKFGAMFIDFTDVEAIHEFLVAYHDEQRDYNVKRSQSPNGLLMASNPSYEVIGESLQAVPFAYKTFFQQCDSRWRNDYMGSQTVCQVGCLMNSVCVGARGHGVKVGSSNCDPKVFNKWLRSNGGYSGNLFIHGVVNKLCKGKSNCKSSFPGDGAKGKMSLSNVQAMLKKKRVMVANVKNGGHWVLAYGWDNSNPNRILTRDSGGANRAWHNLSEVVGWRIYDFVGPNTKGTWDYDVVMNNGDSYHHYNDMSIDEIAQDLGL